MKGGEGEVHTPAPILPSTALLLGPSSCGQALLAGACSEANIFKEQSSWPLASAEDGERVYFEEPP